MKLRLKQHVNDQRSHQGWDIDNKNTVQGKFYPGLLLIINYHTVLYTLLCMSRLITLYILGRYVQAGEGTNLVSENLNKYQTA